MRKKLIVVTGPTAIGKTDEAIRLAQQLSCPIISADSRQVYTELNIGVARPDEAQLAAATHYLVAHVSIQDNYNAGRYAQEARALVNELFDTHDHLLVCGGTGLYIQALLHGLDPLPGRNDELRSELDQLLQEKGIEALQEMLKAADPERYVAIDIQNPQRLARAIEIASSPMPEKTSLPEFAHAFDTEWVKMSCDREELYQRINLRVDRMVEMGLEEEVRSLAPQKHLNALQTVGYSEWWPYFEGLASRGDVIDKIKQHTRNYAKRQLTWMRNRS